MRLLGYFMFAIVTVLCALALIVLLIVGGFFYLGGVYDQKQAERFQHLLTGTPITRITITGEGKSFELTDRVSLDYLGKRFQEAKSGLIQHEDYELTAYLSTGEVISCMINADMPLKKREFLLVSPTWDGIRPYYRILLTGDIPGPLVKILAEIERAQSERKTKKG